jgi:hypothetical protein
MELTPPLMLDGYVLDEPTGILAGLKANDLPSTREERIAMLKREVPAIKSVRITVGEDETTTPERKKLLLMNPHTAEFCREWNLLGCGEENKGKERAFPLNPLEQPGVFENMKPIFNKLRSCGDIPSMAPVEINFRNLRQNEVIAEVRKEWEHRQPDVPFPTNYFLNFWALMEVDPSYEKKTREQIMKEWNTENTQSLEFATQNQQAGIEEHSYNAETPLEERPLKRRFVSKEINVDQVD